MSEKKKVNKNQVADLSKAFVTKHLNAEIRRRGLMVGSKSGVDQAIKAVLASCYLNLVDQIEHLTKNLAKKVIVTKEVVQTAAGSAVIKEQS